MGQTNFNNFNTEALQKLDNVISLAAYLLEINNKKLHIVHLDDHNLFRKGIKLCLLKNLPNILIEGFPNNETALGYLTDCFQHKKRIDLIITDFNHPGPNGLLFAKEVRELEKLFFIKTPLMLLTMCWKNEVLSKATEEGIFDVYFPKSIDTAQLIKFVKNSNL